MIAPVRTSHVLQERQIRHDNMGLAWSGLRVELLSVVNTDSTGMDFVLHISLHKNRSCLLGNAAHTDS